MRVCWRRERGCTDTAGPNKHFLVHRFCVIQNTGAEKRMLAPKLSPSLTDNVKSHYVATCPHACGFCHWLSDKSVIIDCCYVVWHCWGRNTVMSYIIVESWLFIRIGPHDPIGITILWWNMRGRLSRSGEHLSNRNTVCIIVFLQITCKLKIYKRYKKVLDHKKS